MKKLKLTILSPESVILKEKSVDYVSLPAFEGSMGVLPGHAKAVVQLGHGILHYTAENKRDEFAVLGGYAEVYKDDVTVLAEEAALAEEINEEEEKQKIAKARAALSSRDADIDFELAEIELKASLMKMRLKNRQSRN